MTGCVLWYVHDRGRGHLDRARAVIPLVRAPVVVAAGPGIHATADEVLDVPVVRLPSDVPDRPWRTVGPWHHAPAGPALRDRSMALIDAVRRFGCTTAVVDVSVEVTALARLLGLRVVTLRQSGYRTDAAHRIGLDSADVVWVPQHRDLEPIGHDTDRRWVFTGPFSRFDGMMPAGAPRRPVSGRRLVVLMVGRGGTTLDLDAWRDAHAPAGWRVVIAGSPHHATSCHVDLVGCREPVLPLLAEADVVVTSAGWAAVADTVAAGARLAVVPEDRPFDEQVVRARALADAGLATYCAHWPTPHSLADVLDATHSQEPERWRRYHDGCGAHRAATTIDELHAR
ncbi:MAG: hypothetical protein H0U21_17860 [Acidimicrobiia bacterium]|nr:hypothetical protein [Acidimicrobiia bacterium]